MDQLAVFDRLQVPPCLLPPSLCEIVTPLRWAAWDSQLSHHPDQRFRYYIVDGIKHGFKVGFNYTCPISVLYWPIWFPLGSSTSFF